jgi:threonine dehydrogenase-like Zn-dependent dehydrogenase
MQRVVLGGKRAWLEDVPDPTPEGEWVVVKMHASPICGSDMHAYHAEGEHHGGGHEGVGEVVAVDTAHRLKVGDRVLVNPASGCGECWRCRSGYYIHCRNMPPGSGGHFAQYVRKQEWLCPKLPDDLDYDLASLMGCGLSPAYQALTRMGVSAFHSLLVTGLGPVGLGAVALAKFMGAEVIAVDPEPWRCERARQIGAEEALDPTEVDVLQSVRDRTAGEGVHRALDASGKPDAERLCIDAVRALGKIAFIGENPNTIGYSPSNDGIRRGIEIIAAWHQNLTSVDDLITFLRRFPHAGKLISHTFGFSQVDEAFATFAGRESAKVVLHPWE